MNNNLTQIDNNDNKNNSVLEPYNRLRFHRRKPQNDKFFKIRNILNLVFMVGAVAGMLMYYFADRTMAIIVILAAMFFKVAECCFRFIRQ